MLICLSCYYIWPSGSQVCGHCGRSFGGRVCRHRHLSPIGAQYCLRCGSAELTEPTRFLSLHWVSRCLAWLCLIVAIRWLWSHLPSVLQTIGVVTDWVWSLVPPAMKQTIAEWLVTLFVIWIFVAVMPGKTGQALRRRLFGSVRLVSRLGRWGLRLLGWVRWLVEGEGRRRRSQHND